MSVASKSAESRTGQPLSLPAYSIAGLAGVSFRHEHLAAILAERGQDVFFEVRADNYMGGPHTIRRSRRYAAILRLMSRPEAAEKQDALATTMQEDFDRFLIRDAVAPDTPYSCQTAERPTC